MPLILPSQRVIRPNPLVYPAGATPGFDPSHAALTGSTRLWCSAVANNGLFTQIAPTCQVASIDTVGTGSYSSRMDGLAGTCIRAGTVGQALTYGFPTSVGGAVPSPLTFAAIVNIQDITTTFQTIMTLGSSGGSHAYFYITAGVLELFFSGAGANDAIGISFKVGHSYFVAASSSPAGVNFVSRDLSTGIIQTSSIALGAGVGSFTLSSVTFCNDSFGDTGPNAVACGAAIQNFLSISQLVAWAADPWAFWYPRRTIQYTTPATTTTSGGARIRQRWNRSPLAYPAGAVPGIDRSHPAAENLILSAVASAGPNYIDVRTGAPLTNQNGAQTSAPSASIVGSLGPAVTSLNGGQALGIAFDSGRTIAAITTAAIFKFASVHQGSGYQTLIAFGGSRGMWTVNDTVTLYLGSDTVSATLDFDAPHFVAASAIVNGASSPIYLVLRNLKTGQTFTTITTHGNAAFSGLSNVTVGQDVANEWSLFPVAAAMCSNVFLSPAQLLAWGKDPWAFWYPNKTINLASSTASAGASFLPVWAYRYNLPVLGTGNF